LFFAAVSETLVGRPRFGHPYVKGIRPIKLRMTEYGRQYVMNKKSVIVYDMEKLKEKMRMF
jgi:hypothetical protein